ncbi:Pentatricopeptide repeat [Macleaya cordata]|uniref:Pentatricopeptide repeat n=1 Tax=Macleaya cordata TaxID=56857 RepID=A0A200Q3T4_MACCD|nr:Pentatricopeptide repeat [Macleaya cordata]
MTLSISSSGTSRPAKIFISLLKNSAHNIRQLGQIFAQTITTGCIYCPLTWNSIIRAYSKSPTPIKAILIYNHIIKPTTFVVLPDNHTYPALLKACSRLPSLPKAKEIHGHLTKSGLLHSDIYINNSLIHLYRTLGQAKDARRVFDEMYHRDLVSWNSVLGVYSSCPDLWVEALVLFKRMLYVGVEADAVTIIILLSACGLVREGIEYGRAIHAYVMKVGIGFSLNLENSLLSLYSKGGDMNTAIRLFNEMMGQRDVASCTILINGYVGLGLVDQAREIFDRMDVKDHVSWNSMINGYVKANQPKEALELFKEMEMDDVSPDEKTVVSLLSACACLSELRLGRLVHNFIIERNIRFDVFVGTALVNMYAKCGSLEEAMVTFHKLDYKDVFTWTTAVTALANYGRGNEALMLFREMQKEGIEPNEATFVAVLTACSQSGLVEEGCELFNSMHRLFSIQPRIEHFGCLVDLLSRAGLLSHAEKFVRTMPVDEKIIAYKTILSACISYFDIELGENVAKEMIKLRPQSHGVYVLLSNFYALANQWDKVVEMRRIMKESSMRKEIGISFIDIKT